MVEGKALSFNAWFIGVLVLFALIQALGLYYRDGKDLKVGLYGTIQVLNKKSPYVNPTDPHRIIFRYAPGITLLEQPFVLSTKVVGPYQFKNIRPSVFAWFMAELLALAGSVWLLWRLVPAPSWEIGRRNLQWSLLLALPLIGDEMANSQNKLVALFFLLAAVFLFEKKKLLWSAMALNLALTIYVALLPFVFYFIIRDRKFIWHFLLGAGTVFLLWPSLAWGPAFNAFLLKQWFLSLKPFFLTHSYATYIDLRDSSQALPSAIGRMFVSGHTGNFHYLISPVLIHVMIRAVSAAIMLISCWAVWKNRQGQWRGLAYVVFLIPALILPQYCVYYTWAYVLVVYYALLNYAELPGMAMGQRRFLWAVVWFLFVSSCLVFVHWIDQISLLCWATLLSWMAAARPLLKHRLDPANMK